MVKSSVPKVKLVLGVLFTIKLLLVPLKLPAYVAGNKLSVSAMLVVNPVPIFEKVKFPIKLALFPVTTNTLALPPTLVDTTPPLVAILTLLDPLLILDVLAPGANTPLPYSILLLLPSKFSVAILPMPTTLATSTE